MSKPFRNAADYTALLSKTLVVDLSGIMSALKETSLWKHLIKDLRYGVRSFLKRPGFLVIAVSTLALGIGATTAMFTVVNSVLLRPLQFPEPERIVLLEGVNPRQGITQSNMSVPDIADWQQQSQSFEQIAGFVSGGVFLSLNEETERVRATAVTADFFPLFRTNPIAGRTFQASDMQPGAEPVAVIGYGTLATTFWWFDECAEQQSDDRRQSYDDRWDHARRALTIQQIPKCGRRFR